MIDALLLVALLTFGPLVVGGLVGLIVGSVLDLRDVQRGLL
jgi:type III secretory pathway component EscS